VVAIAKLALGIALIVIAAAQARTHRRPRILTIVLTRLDTMTPWTAAVLAALVQPWTLVAAGAITAAQARLSTARDYLALASFCLLATSSFAALELYAVRAPAAASTRLATLRTWLDTHANQVIIIVCAVLGLWLTGRSIHTLITA
jgi:Sap, sulfolipid-1-addressing protein